MRSFILLLCTAPTFLLGQTCPNDPSPISLEGLNKQVIDVDCFENEAFLNSLNPTEHQIWNLGTGISDNNLTSINNDDITTFLAAKLRNAVAPNDNLANAGNAYLADPGASDESSEDESGTNTSEGLANWNVIMYVGLDEESGANFNNVNVIFHIDFDPAECYDVSQMASLNIGDELANQDLGGIELSAFGINSNLGFDLFQALNSGDDFDPFARGYYTFAIEVVDHCGNQKMWNEITVHVDSSVNPEPSVSLDGVVYPQESIDAWGSTKYIKGTIGNIDEEEITWVDSAGRLANGSFSTNRLYSVPDHCGNITEVAQLLIADNSYPAGCTNELATNYDGNAVNDNGNCDYSPACPSDLNHDNVIGTTDLLTFLSSFGLPCPQ